MTFSSETDIWDDVIRVGLVVGALVQLAAISAVVWLPANHDQTAERANDAREGRRARDKKRSKKRK